MTNLQILGALLILSSAALHPQDARPSKPAVLNKSIQITLPSDRAQVPVRAMIEGIVGDPNAKVWVIVHPMETSDYWVQPSTTVKEDGTWRVQVYFGRGG